MDKPDSAVLVPDTPTATAESPATYPEQSHSQSYLLTFLKQDKQQSASSPGLSHDHTTFVFHSQRPRKWSPRRRLLSDEDDSRLDRSGNDDLSTVVDHQMASHRLSQRAGYEQEAGDALARHRRRVSAEVDNTQTNSQPIQGPGHDEEGYLGQTQAESLDTKMRRRENRNSDGGRESRQGQLDEEEREELDEDEDDRDGEVSMDLTRAGGRLLERSGFDDGDPSHPKPQLSDSQKENPSATRSTAAPHPVASASVPFRASQSHIDSSGAPSSSPFVAAELLQRSPVKKTAVSEPASSADPDIPLGELIGAKAGQNRQSRVIGLVGMSVSGPETSTPAYAVIPPPQPMTAARTLPTFDFPSQSSTDLSLLPSRSVPAMPPRDASGVDVFATSAAMKAPLPPKKDKKKAEPWDGLSQSTIRTTQDEEESPYLPQTIPHLEDEEASRRSQGTPRPTAERTVDMDLDESGTPDLTAGTGAIDDSLGTNSTAVCAPRPALTELEQEDSLDAPPRRKPSEPPLFARASSSPSQESLSRQSQLSSKIVGRGGKRLSDIAGSSPQPTQYEVPATQDQYDALPQSNESTVRTQDVTIDNSENRHGAFAFDTTTAGRSRTTTAGSNPPLGRQLHRQPPPPTPVREGLVRYPHHPPPSPLRSGHSAPFSSKQDSLPIEATQLDAEESLQLPVPQAHILKPHPLPAMQHVPESSPEVPLASKRPQPKQRSSRSPSRPPQPSASTSSGQPQQQTVSSNGVVPDSEGPTQPVAGPFGEKAAAQASISHSPIMELQEKRQVPPGDFYQEDFGGGFDDEEDQEMKDAEDELDDEQDGLPDSGLPPRPRKGKQDKRKERDRDEEPEQGRRKKAGTSRKAPTVKKATSSKAAAAALGKGKGRALQAQKTPDALDLLSTSSSTRRRHVGDSAATAEQTNYTDLPSVKNAKKRSPRKAARTTFVQAPAKGNGKKSGADSQDERAEQEDDDTEGELEEDGEEEPRPARKRRKTSKAVDEESAGEVPSKGSRASKGKAVAKKTGASSKKGKEVAAPKEKKGGRGRHSKTASVSSSLSPPALLPEPQQPIAGPSRLRDHHNNHDHSSRAGSPANTEARSNASLSRSKSRLPSSVPFSRCLAMWRDDKYFYPGTIASISGGLFVLVFDDGSTGRIKPEELRRCDLQTGDLVQYWGNDFDTETQCAALSDDVRVIRVERNTSGDDVDGPLEQDDIVVAASTNDDEGRIHRLNLLAVRISPRHSQQLDNRKLTIEELMMFGCREGTPIVPLQLAKPPKPIVVKPFEPNAATSGLFGKMAFLNTSSDKNALSRQIESNGGTVIDWEHLLSVNVEKGSTNPPSIFFPRIDFERVDEIFLLADRPCTTSKYLIALALGIPCLSKAFVTLSVEGKTRLPWQRFVLPAGYVQELKTQALGGQLEAIRKPSFDLDSLKQVYETGGVFKDHSFLVVDSGKKLRSKDEKESAARHSYTILALVAAASASLVHFVASPVDASSAQGYDFVFVDEESKTLPRPLATHKGLVNIVWVKQCLMAGRLLPAARMKADEEAK
ncbi:hypothetical protein JCM11641_003685 [Rhodosporidiobolus odoratus]